MPPLRTFSSSSTRHRVSCTTTHPLQAVATLSSELELVTTKAFTQLEETQQKLDHLEKSAQDNHYSVSSNFQAFSESHPQQMRDHVEQAVETMRNAQQQQLQELEGKRLAFERKLAAEEDKRQRLFNTLQNTLQVTTAEQEQKLLGLATRVETDVELLGKKIGAAENGAAMAVAETHILL